VGFKLHALLVTSSVAMMQLFGRTQALPFPPHTPSQSSLMTVSEGRTEHEAASTQDGSPGQKTNVCSFRPLDEVSAASSTTATTGTKGPLAYSPLSARCKFHLFLKQTYSPYTFASAAFQTALDQAEGQWPQYGGGMQGWAKRFGATLADTESRRFIQGFALSTMLHEDPRYFPSQKHSLIARGWYAATRVIVTRKDSGHSTFNMSEILGALFTSSLQNCYLPRHDRTFANTINRYGGALSSDASGNVLREFTPDMKRLFRKHAPKDIQRIEEKLPIPRNEKP
jgi:hypothetical protein